MFNKICVSSIKLIFFITLFDNVISLNENNQTKNQSAVLIQKIQTAIENFNTGNLNLSQNEIQSFEDEYQKIFKPLNIQIKEMKRKIENDRKILKNYLHSKIDLQNKMNSFYTAIISNAIRTNDFENSDHYIMKMGLTQSNIDGIFLAISNFDLMNDYARKSNNTDVIFLILNKLWNQIQLEVRRDNNSLAKFCEIHESFKGFLNRNGVDAAMKQSSGEILKKIESKILTIASKQLQNVLFSKKIPNRKETIQSVANLVFNTNEQIFDMVMKEICNNANLQYYDTHSQEFIKGIFDLENAAHIAAALLQLFPKILQNPEMNNTAPFLIANSISKLEKNLGYNAISSLKKQKLKNYIKLLSDSVKNLYFLSEICLENVYNKNIIFSPNPLGINRRFVLNQAKRTIRDLPEAKWRAKSDNDNFRFQFENVKYYNEYIYVGAVRGGRRNFHNVLICPNERCLKNETFWEIGLNNGNQINVINSKTKEYLCIETKSRFVYTMPSVKTNSKECLWMIVDC